ncbi:MAG: cation:proton antiporter [Lachnospiraceae bacterium]|nr:cation:proton antiporter [Lachnospiraceae bacterium]
MLVLLLITWALFAGLLMTRLTNIFRLPDVTAYLIVGVIIGPSVLGKFGIEGVGFVSFEEVERLSIISDVALGFIAFSIGNEFKLSDLKHIGRQAFIIGVFQALTATLLVDIALFIMHIIMPNIVTIPMAITLGAIAAATAPAATLMVIKQYKAKGPVTDILLPVVALDDAVGLVIFAGSFGAASAMISGNANVLNLIVEPILEIIMSLLLGSIVAIILTYLESKFHSNTNRLILIIGSIILTVAIAKASFKFGRFGGSFSPLLVCMMLGTVFCNICPLSDELMDTSDKWSQPILVLFFVLSGAELDLAVFKNPIVILVGFVYIIARSFGKYIGARVSADMSGSKEVVKKYLGITLLPQAGVALGMSAIVARSLGSNGNLIRNITLFGVLIYELIGPTLTKIALTKAGDIKAKPKEVINRRNKKLKAVRRKEILKKIIH